MNNDCLEVDELILEIADYKSDFASASLGALLMKYCVHPSDGAGDRVNGTITILPTPGIVSIFRLSIPRSFMSLNTADTSLILH